VLTIAVAYARQAELFVLPDPALLYRDQVATSEPLRALVTARFKRPEGDPRGAVRGVLGVVRGNAPPLFYEIAIPWPS
jgi:hypothetical protein